MHLLLPLFFNIKPIAFLQFYIQQIIKILYCFLLNIIQQWKIWVTYIFHCKTTTTIISHLFSLLLNIDIHTQSLTPLVVLSILHTYLRMSVYPFACGPTLCHICHNPSPNNSTICHISPISMFCSVTIRSISHQYISLLFYNLHL